MRKHRWRSRGLFFLPREEYRASDGVLTADCEHCGLERWDRDVENVFKTYTEQVKYIREGSLKQDWQRGYEARVPPCRSNEEDINAFPIHRKDIIEQMAHEVRNALLPSQYSLERLFRNQDPTPEQKEIVSKIEEGMLRVFKFVDEAVRSL